MDSAYIDGIRTRAIELFNIALTFPSILFVKTNDGFCGFLSKSYLEYKNKHSLQKKLYEEKVPTGTKSDRQGTNNDHHYWGKNQKPAIACFSFVLKQVRFGSNNSVWKGLLGFRSGCCFYIKQLRIQIAELFGYSFPTKHRFYPMAGILAQAIAPAFIG